MSYMMNPPVIGAPRPLKPEDARASAARHGRRFDREQKAPWYAYRDGKRWRQGWYEDDESYAAKLDLVGEYGLGSVCLWVLDGASEPQSTFSIIGCELRPRP